MTCLGSLNHYTQITMAGVVSKAQGGKFIDGVKGAVAGVVISAAIKWAMTPSSQSPADAIRSGQDPDGAQYNSVAHKGTLGGLQEVDGVLTGELDVGCNGSSSLCDQAFTKMESINDSESINLKINRSYNSSSNSGLDIQMELGSYNVNGSHTPATSGGWFSGRTPDIIKLDFSRVNTSTVLHEFGHALGHVHRLNSTNSVMSYSGSRRTNFSAEEAGNIARAYR